MLFFVAVRFVLVHSVLYALVEEKGGVLYYLGAWGFWFREWYELVRGLVNGGGLDVAVVMMRREERIDVVRLDG